MKEGSKGRREAGIKNDWDSLSLTKWEIISKWGGSNKLLGEGLSQRNEYLMMEFGASHQDLEENS